MQSDGGEPGTANQNRVADQPHIPSPRPCTQLKLFTTDMERNTRTPLFTTTEIICGVFSTLQDHYFEKRQRAFPLTINPGYSNAFKECNPQKAHTTGCIVVKELKHVHATLEKKKRRAALIISLICMERKKVTEMGGAGGGVESSAQECWHLTNRGRVQQVLRRHWSTVNC